MFLILMLLSSKHSQQPQTCFLLYVGFNKASITDMDLDPEDMEADIFDDVSTNETQ
jgi:hypothetical protein